MATTVRPAAGLMTVEEFYEYVNRPENGDRFFELDEGKVIELPPAKKRHGVICATIARLIGNHAAATGRGRVASNNAGVILGRGPDTVRGPDVAYFAERLSDEELEAEGYARTPPVLVAEVLSPDDRWRTVNRKVMQYLRAGVKVVWVVDPETHDVTVHRPGQEVEGFGAEDLLTGGEELPGFGCRVEEFFGAEGGAGRA